MGGSALASAGGNIFSSIMGNSAAKQQAAATRYAADKAQETAYELDTRQRKDLQPYMNLGTQSGDLISQILSGSTSLEDVLGKSSIFQWQQQEGERAIDRQLAARGQYNSGVGLETLARFNNQLVAEEGERYWSRLFNTTTLGANAAARTATNTTAIGSNLTDTQARLGSQEAMALGDATRSLAGIGPGLADPFAGGVKSLMSYELYKPILDKYGAPSSSPGSSTSVYSDPGYRIDYQR